MPILNAKDLTVVITGGRKFDRADLVFNALGQLHSTCNIKQMFVGGARGADTIAESWAMHNQVPTTVVKADWGSFGKSAGSKRNTEMLLRAWDFGGELVLVAFPGGRGTRDCLHKASKMTEFTILTPYAGYDYVG